MPTLNPIPHLYLDYDGVMHPDPVFHNPGVGPLLDARYVAHRLFENAELLSLMLEPHPDVRLVLSTSWVQAYGFDATVAQLPKQLRARVVGATFDPARDSQAFGSVARGYQIAADAEQRGLRHWAALDDDVRDWPEEHHEHLIGTDPVFGIRGTAAFQNLQSWLLNTKGGL